ncbi:MAG: hypothetical protein ACOC5L_02380 [Halobacteriota archaeon]
MNSVAVNSFIIGARSILIFGKDGEEQEQWSEMDENRLHFLLNLANLIGIGIIGNIARKYNQLGLDVEDEEIGDDIEDEVTMAMIDALNDIKHNGTNGRTSRNCHRILSDLNRPMKTNLNGPAHEHLCPTSC